MPGPPLRIVQVVESLAVGGLEVMALELAIAHRQAGHFSAIYTVFEPGVLAARALAAGVPVVPFHKRRGFSAGAIFRLAGRLRSDRAEIVHTHNASIHHYGALAGKLAGALVVNTRHGLALHSAPRQEVYFRAVLPLTEAVVFVSEYGRRYFADKGSAPASKSLVIRNGIALDPFRQARATPGARLPAIRFGTVGRLVPAKAHRDLLEAFALVARELPDAELHIWGYGALQKELESAIAALGLGDRVRYRGAATHAAEALRELDIFVLSSVSEGLPLVILEAMAAGLPIVSTRVGGVPEVAPEHAGPDGVAWFAEPGNPPSLAEAMRQAARSDLAAAGRAASAIADASFGVEVMQRQYEGLFRQLPARS